MAFHHAGDDTAGTLALWDEQHMWEGIGLRLSFLRCPPGFQRVPSHRWDSLYVCLIYIQGRNCLIMCTVDD